MERELIDGYMWVLAQVLNKAFGISAEDLNEDYIDDFFDKEYHITALAITDEKFGMRGLIMPADENDVRAFVTPKWTPLEVFPNASLMDILSGDKEGYTWKTKYCCCAMFLINEVCGQ